MRVRHVLPAGTPVLEELVLAEQSWLTLAAAILHALGKAFGPQAGILLDDPSWGVARKGLRGAKTFPIGKFGTIAVPRGADCAGALPGGAQPHAGSLCGGY